MLESPVAGRSARSVCWVSGVNQWILWAATMIHNHAESTRQDAAFLRNHIPISTVAVPFLAVGLVGWALCRKGRTSGSRGVSFTCSAWHEDFAMAFFCCAPALLLMVNFRFVHIEYIDEESKHLSWYDFQHETIRRSLLLYTSGLQTLVQAGCHPLICAAAAASLTAASFLVWPLELVRKTDMGPVGSYIFFAPVVIQSALAWFLVLSHLIDFFARMRAIERGMHQSRQNAASSQRLPDLFRCSLGNILRTLQTCLAPNLGTSFSLLIFF